MEEIGLTPSKSRTLGLLQIPDLYFRDFLRGKFDGDGCWSMEKRPKGGRLLAVFTSGSRSYLEWLRSSIERLANIRKVISGISICAIKEILQNDWGSISTTNQAFQA